MGNDDIAAVLENIARLLEIKGENPFKLRAYVNGARAAETYPGDLKAAVADGSISSIDGFGKALVEKVSELVTTGRMEYYEKLREEFPADILTLFELQGLGGKKIKVLYDSLGVHSITSLERACHDGSVAALPGFGEKTAANLLKAIDHRKRHAGQFLLDQAMPLAEALLAGLRDHPAVNQVEIAGSYRRRKPVVRDLDFIVSTKEPAAVIEYFATHDVVESVLAKGATKASVLVRGGIQCDLRAVSGAEYPFALGYFTGSKEHNIRMRSRALERGWTLNEYRLAVEREGADPPPEVRTETDLYTALGLEFIPPELREDLGEFDAAEARELPALVEWSNLRGTFHNHTTASDGRATLEQMAEAARDLGLDYLGIADHSKSSFQANGLDEKRLLGQVEEIRRMNLESGDGFRLFAGTECDIRKDGTLDFDDDVLARLDYVVASVHNAFSLGEAEMTKRVISAMENPFVTMLGHITGRLLLTREPYAINIPAVIDAAAATGTIIELNANPRRLELDWTWWPLARSKGVKCSINPDAHSTEGLGHLIFGVGIARKGWLTRSDVINTLGVDQVTAALAAKRPK
ncbi:MAG: DNA polymerase/3'-5' exonuclease PolX [Terrimicrobiaceae bacterium]